MTISLIVTIAVILFLVIFMISGICRGFLRVLLSALSLVITLVLAGVFAGPLADFVENKTDIGTSVTQKVDERLNSMVSSLGGDVDAMQESLINSLPLPESTKTDLTEKYSLYSSNEIGVQTFVRSISSSLSSLILKILSFVLLFIVIFLILRLILGLSHLINHIPVLGAINRLLGAVLGIAEGVIFLWIICMGVMLLTGTPAGAACEEVIRDSKALTFIYDHNYLMIIVNSVLGLFKIHI